MTDTSARDEIRAVIDELISALGAGDAASVRRALSDRADAVHIGSDPGEWWTSAELVAAMGGLGDEGAEVVADDLEVHVSGEVGWAEGHMRFTLPDGAERQARLTAVLAREDGQWRVVQSHSSIGVPNEDIFG